MKITRSSAETFTLTVEDDADQEFVDTLHHHSNNLMVNKYIPREGDGVGGWTMAGVVVDLSDSSPRALSDKAARELMSAFQEIVSLGLTHAANNGLVAPDAAHPQS